MTPERWRQIDSIFEQASELSAQERDSFLKSACGNDEELRREVESLLSGDHFSGSFFSTAIHAAAQSLASTSIDDLVGREIGSYRLTGLIGRGGMAEVFLAVRDDDQYQQQVAIKLVRRGMITDFMLDRFRHERQMLATLEHPNIGRLLDGGDDRRRVALPGDGVHRRQTHHQLLQTQPTYDAPTIEPLSVCLRGRTARAPKSDNPPRPEAKQHSGYEGMRPQAS